MATASPSTVTWRSAQTASFVVYAAAAENEAGGFAQDCESLRAGLMAKWLGLASPPPWNPRCIVVLHADQASYLAAVGEQGVQTSGSSLTQVGGERVVLRRIDLSADHPGRASATLPHELTHVVLADHFLRRPPPRWADEGMAVLADTAQKRSAHRSDLERVLRCGLAFPVGDLCRRESCPAAQQAAFYGQSVSLVEFLVSRRGPQQIVPFLDKAALVGMDRALAEDFAIRDTAELEHQWRAFLASSSASAPPVIFAGTPGPAKGSVP
jgi:hypothetical protein